MLQSLNHDSNVVQFLGACISRDSRQAFMVLEYMEVSPLGMAAWLMQSVQRVGSGGMRCLMIK